ncbi:UNVERIFIED_CONTAM: hypothetical protein PYX00_004090 [Menopon gallinae]|uniref:ditrans,polycis-polyprenyl diphosphate synthase [(2E,6E)-farnesyldiphosphate specific] n=1 Tax=Menopon gallinae TaxID=328185 RepID=A0AAW2I4Y4_9NEOP
MASGKEVGLWQFRGPLRGSFGALSYEPRNFVTVTSHRVWSKFSSRMECSSQRPTLIIQAVMAETIFLLRSGIFRLIISFLHLVYSGLEHFDKAWALFKRKLERRFHLRVRDSESYVSDFVTTLKKCPSHLAVITGTEKVNFEDFSNLVIWCLAAGISYISFYDCTGYLKDNKEIYFKYLVNNKKLDPNYVSFSSNMNGVRNGCKKNGFKRKIHVNILSIEDGKPLFVKLVKNLWGKALSSEINAVDINERLIDEEMHNMIGFIDPELAIICGRVQSTFGFLPWHIRLTEFLQIPTIENINVSEFTSILKRYSMCNQRFGT